MIVLMTLLLVLLPIQAQENNLCDTPILRLVEWQPTGDEYAIGFCDRILRYDATTMTLIDRIDLNDNLSAAAYQPMGDWLAIATSEFVMMVDTTTDERHIIDSGAQGLAWRDDGTQLAQASDNVIQIITVDTWALIAEQSAPNQAPLLVDWESDRSVRFGDEFDLFTWYVDSAQITRYRLYHSPDDVRPAWVSGGTELDIDIWFEDAVFFSPGNSFTYGELGFWRYKTGEWISAKIDVPDFTFFWNINAHPQDTIFALGALSHIYIYDAETLKIIETYPTNDLNDVPMPTCTEDAPAEDQLYDIVAWHPDGESLLVVSPCRMAIISMDE